MKKTPTKLPFFSRLLGRQDAEQEKDTEKKAPQESSKEKPALIHTMKFPSDADET